MGIISKLSPKNVPRPLVEDFFLYLCENESLWQGLLNTISTLRTGVVQRRPPSTFLLVQVDLVKEWELVRASIQNGGMMRTSVP